MQHIRLGEGIGGTFKSRVTINGVSYDTIKTFFPPDMPPKEVIDCIAEALREGIVQKSDNGFKKIVGPTRAGFEIEMILDMNQKPPKVVTAYPLVGEKLCLK